MKREIKDIAKVLREAPHYPIPQQGLSGISNAYEQQKMPEVVLDASIIQIALSIISVRDGSGRNNALVGGYMTCMSDDPTTIMVAIGKSRFSDHMVQENPAIVINMFNAANIKEYRVFGGMSGRNVDKFAAADVKWQDGDVVNAPVLTDCPVNLECSVIKSAFSKTHEMFYCRVEKVHVDEKYLNQDGNILWGEMNLIYSV